MSRRGFPRRTVYDEQLVRSAIRSPAAPRETWQGEAQALVQSPGRPMVHARLVEGLQRLGIDAGQTIVVHSSLSAFGWVCGGPQALIEALMEAVSPAGTLVMPTHSTHLSEPGTWGAPAVPPGWVDEVKDTLPAFDVHRTPTRSMGVTCELFRNLPGVVRSNHPQSSFAAWGQHAAQVTSNHALAWGLGETSPLGRLYDLDAQVVLLGVGHANNTSLHLSEYRADWPGKSTMVTGSPLLVDGVRKWVNYDDLQLDSTDFAEIGQDFERETGLVHHLTIGKALCKRMPMRALVDFGTEWMTANRPWVSG